jgi:diguanylate cyclase (GGDEF)-like protein/PAS domain S-box-containing protein
MFRRQFEIISGGVFFILVATWVLRRRVALPIERLTRSSRERSQEGKTTAPIDAAGPGEISASAYKEPPGTLEGELVQRTRSEELTGTAEESYRLLFDSNPQPMWVYHRTSLRFLAVNDAAVSHYGYSREEFLEMTIRGIRPGPDIPAVEDSAATDQVLDRSGPWRHMKRDGTEIEVEISSHSLNFAGDEARCVMATDITERQLFDRQLRELALSDSLTGLANQTKVLDRIDQALSRARAAGGTVGVLSLDLDNFSVLNQVHGRQVGDRLLCAVAERLRSVIGQADTLGRVGADEYAVVCDGQLGIRHVAGLAEELRSCLRPAFSFDGHEIFVSASIGVDMSNGYRDADEMLRDAGAAMRRAKELGGARVETFDSAILMKGRRRLQVENGLRQAVERSELRLLYQPVMDLATGRCHGAEALMRWEHPDWGLLGPADFLPVAEETGLILEMGHWAIQEACSQAARWIGRPGFPQVVSVNLAARQMGELDLILHVTDALDSAGLDPGVLGVELTETALMHDVEDALRTVRALHETGIKVSVDDFGTGYSSLLYLRRFPVDYLKVDRVFVSEIDTDQSDAAIVSGVVSLGHSLGMTIVAEGVETDSQLDMLRQMGCDLGQGFLWARPLPVDELDALLAGSVVSE